MNGIEYIIVGDSIEYPEYGECLVYTCGKDKEWAEKFLECIEYEGSVLREYHKKFEKEIFKLVYANLKKLFNEYNIAQKFVSMSKNMADINKLEQKYQSKIAKLEEHIKELSQSKTRRKSK